MKSKLIISLHKAERLEFSIKRDFQISESTENVLLTFCTAEIGTVTLFLKILKCENRIECYRNKIHMTIWLGNRQAAAELRREAGIED